MPTKNKPVLFADRLRAIRGEKKITQKDLASKVGCHEVYIRQLETGSRVSPGWIIVCKLAEALGVELKEFQEIRNS
jgi:transcriptional regulator with XRE-family HTH domain